MITSSLNAFAKSAIMTSLLAWGAAAMAQDPVSYTHLTLPTTPYV